MPKVQALPLGQLGTMIRTQLDSKSDTLSRRNSLNLAANTTDGGIVTQNTSPQIPAPWPQITVNVGGSGAVWVMYSFSDPNTITANTNLFVAVDGVGHGAGNGIEFSGTFGLGISGLTPGFHTFQLGTSTGGKTIGSHFGGGLWLMVWPL